MPRILLTASCAALLATVTLAGTAQAGPADPLQAWVKSLGQAHRAHLERVRAPEGGELWRERQATEAVLPGFVPPTSLAPLVKSVSTGVVNVSTSLDAPGRGGADRARRSLGSGFVIGPDGFVVTNNHVVEAAHSILVQLSDGREYTAQVVGRDAATDVALLRLQGAPGDLPFVYLGDSDALEVGDWVVAIGNPFGLDHSVSHGMISAKERVLGIGVFDDFIQTDALINPGNSGGPLFNMRGEVVGVNTAIMSQGQGIGFAVPIDLVKELIPNLRENGRLARGWLGVNIVEAPGAARAAVVSEVFRGSPAFAAGLKPGDRVLAVNGRPVERFGQLLRKVSFLAPGSKAILRVERGGAVQELAVTLAERPAPRTLASLSEANRVDALGLLLREVTAESGKSLGLRPHSGILVAGVLPGSPAERAGLRAGDLINEVNRRGVAGLEDFRAALGRGEARTVLVRFQRGDAVRYVAIDER
jgi:serine protease Do